MTVKVYGCPWCGKPPKVISSGAETVVGCVAYSCPVTPGTRGSTAGLAVMAWNGRRLPDQIALYDVSPETAPPPEEFTK